MSKLKAGEYEVKGTVLESLPNLMYRVQIAEGPENMIGQELLAKTSGQMKMFKIKVMPGDGVVVLMTQYDNLRGRITYRTKEPFKAVVPPVVTPELEGEVAQSAPEVPVVEGEAKPVVVEMKNTTEEIKTE